MSYVIIGETSAYLVVSEIICVAALICFDAASIWVHRWGWGRSVGEGTGKYS